MFFNSYNFILFYFPIVIIGYYLFNHLEKYNCAKRFLLLMSVIFYVTFSIKGAFVILVSVLANYLIGRSFSKTKRGRRILLTAGLLFNVGTLMYFKYWNFFIETINDIGGHQLPLKELLIPVGISFFTFQQISFMVDCYRNGNITYKFEDYAMHVIFFPYIISGPIVKHDEIIPQFHDKERKRINYANLSQGLMAFAIGLAKKVLIADMLADVVAVGYGKINSMNSTIAIITMFSYTMQIYFDFSGYSDMALGIGKMLNFDLPLNFDSPYKACSVGEFWKKWHMSLTTFLTRYIYFPLGGNRKGKVRTYVNIMIVFLVSGIWHGASWTFVLWGCMHGIASVAERILRKPLEKVAVGLRWAGTFLFINISWIVFSAPTIQDAFKMIKYVFAGNYGSVPPEMINAFIFPGFSYLFSTYSLSSAVYSLFMNIFLGLCFILCIQMKNTNEIIHNAKYNWKSAIWYSVLLVWSVISLSGIPTFIYVNF